MGGIFNEARSLGAAVGVRGFALESDPCEVLRWCRGGCGRNELHSVNEDGN